MALVRCEGCKAIVEARLPACPVCGRCAGCGNPRVSSDSMRKRTACSECGVPYCCGCGRCHACGKFRFADLSPCPCGHPTDAARIAATEEAHGVVKANRQGGGIGTILLILAGILLVVAVWYASVRIR